MPNINFTNMGTLLPQLAILKIVEKKLLPAL
jgi:hypothetical protein